MVSLYSSVGVRGVGSGMFSPLSLRYLSLSLLDEEEAVKLWRRALGVTGAWSRSREEAGGRGDDMIINNKKGVLATVIASSSLDTSVQTIELFFFSCSFKVPSMYMRRKEFSDKRSGMSLLHTYIQSYLSY